MTKIIDLRSDTVTKPTPAMRSAMANAEVGDDVYGEDPTTNRLEQAAARIFAKEAAIYVPTGTMGNQIGIRLHTQHGQEVICESRAHILDWEMAMISAFSGCSPRTVTGDRGVMTWQQISKAIAPKIYYRAQTGLICLENSHNMAGGTVTPLSVLEEIWAGADKSGLPVHLDGARVFNAATALGLSVAAITRGFATVSCCLSKGLGAPVGSILVGSHDHIEKARIFRKALGGGMRQAGILAAAGLIAIEEMPSRLPGDHANARLIAEAIAPYVDIDLPSVQTNIVLFNLKNEGDASALATTLKSEGVLSSSIGTNAIRLVTHHQITRENCEKVAQVLIKLLNTNR
jgi:threonine aldolase